MAGVRRATVAPAALKTGMRRCQLLSTFDQNFGGANTYPTRFLGLCKGVESV